MKAIFDVSSLSAGDLLGLACAVVREQMARETAKGSAEYAQRGLTPNQGQPTGRIH